MDPTATYRAMMEALYAYDMARANELADDLERWMSRGGFAPGITGNGMADCRRALSDIHEVRKYTVPA